jgi:Spy/CpxP family protein refolding chaperone
MRRVTALIVALAALSAAFPLVASAGHGPPHGGSPNVRAI